MLGENTLQRTFVQVADTELVSGTVLSALARLAERRFTSFSEAADTVLDLLEAELPPGSVLLGQVDWDEGELRLIDVRGAAAGAARAGSTAAAGPQRERRGSGLLDPTALATLSVRSYLALPLETSSGGGALTAVRARLGHRRLQPDPPRAARRGRAACSPTSGRA